MGRAPTARHAGAAFLGVLVALAIVAGVQPAYPAGDGARPAAAIYIGVQGAVAIDGASTGRLPVRFKGELLADANGVPLLRGGRASVYHGRFELNLFGVIPDSCLSSNSLRPVFGSPAATGSGGLLRVIERRKVVMDLDVFVSPELVGFDCRSGDRPLGKVVSLRFRGLLGEAGLASIPLVATAPVRLASGRAGTLRVTVRASIRRLREGAKKVS